MSDEQVIENSLPTEILDSEIAQLKSAEAVVRTAEVDKKIAELQLENAQLKYHATALQLYVKYSMSGADSIDGNRIVRVAK